MIEHTALYNAPRGRSIHYSVGGGMSASSDQQYRTWFEHARDIMLVIDAESGEIIDANLAAEHAYGYPRAELLGLPIFALRVESDSAVGSQMRLADEAGTLFEASHRRRDGSTFPIEVSSRGEALDGRRVLLSVIRDITERRRLEAERERLLATTQQALELRDEFLIVASHELRTPVTHASLVLQQLVRMAERGEPVAALARDTRGALDELGRLAQLVDMLLDAQVVRSRLALECTRFDLGALVREVVERYRPHASRAGSVLSADTVEVVGTWDRLRLDQVLTNLLANAVKYGAGKPVRVAVREDVRSAQIEVRDHGIGLAREDAARIFEKFERAVEPAHYSGFGLGLYITRQIVEAHGGHMEVDSAAGAGATFRVVLPFAAP
jgi:PAS domain S-box-containing protein